MRGVLIAAALVATAFAFVACQDSLAEDGWPCGATRPCASGWSCVAKVCLEGSFSETDAAVTADAQGSPDVALGSDTAETGVDSAGRTAPTMLVAGPATTLGGAAEYIGLAHDGTNLYVGLRGTTDLTLQTVGSGGVLTPFACAGPTADTIELGATASEVLALGPGTVRRCDGSSAQVSASTSALAWDGAHVLTLDGTLLKRRHPSTLAIDTGAASRTLEGDDEGCALLASDDDWIYRWCGAATNGGQFDHTIKVFDGKTANIAKLMASLTATFDATKATGLAARDGKLWVLGPRVGGSEHVIYEADLR